VFYCYYYLAEYLTTTFSGAHLMGEMRDDGLGIRRLVQLYNAQAKIGKNWVSMGKNEVKIGKIW
jgi:hypothetical protein